MSYETKTFRLVPDQWIKLSVDNTDDVDIQARGDIPFMLFIGNAEPVSTFRSDLIRTRASFSGLDDAVIWGKALGGDTMVAVMRRVASGNVQPVELQPLVLGNPILSLSAAAGAEIGTFTTRTSGSTVKLKSDDGTIAVSSDSAKAVVGSVPMDLGRRKVTFVETHPLAVNSGLETVIEFTVLPKLYVGTLDIDETAATGTVLGSVGLAGYAIALVSDGGGMFALSGGSLQVGATALSRATAPAPRVTFRATAGSASFDTVLTINVRKALPALPLPLGALVSAHGDSQVGFQHGAATLGATATTVSAIEHALSVTNNFNLDVWYDDVNDWKGRNMAAPMKFTGANQGIPGDRFIWVSPGQPGFGEGFLARAAYTIAHKPQLVILQSLAFNTLHNGDGESYGRGQYAIDRYAELLKAFRDAGIWVGIVLTYPTSQWQAGDVRLLWLTELNAWLAAKEGTDGIAFVVDGSPVLAPGGTLDARNYLTEVGAQVHLNNRGGSRLGLERLAPKFANSAIIAQGDVYNRDPLTNNLIPASLAQLRGTGSSSDLKGSTGVAGPSGLAAAGCSVRMLRGTTSHVVVCSKEGPTSGIEKQVVEVTPDALGISIGQFSFALPDLTASLITLPKAGDWIEASMFLEVDDTEIISYEQLFLDFIDSTAGGALRARTAWGDGSFAAYADRSKPGNRAQLMRTKKIQVPAGSFDRLRLYSYVWWPKSGITGKAKFKLSCPIIRQATDPRPARAYS